MHTYTGCSLNIVFFQEFSRVCHLTLASTRLLLLVQKITSDVSKGEVAVNCEKTQYFLNTLYQEVRGEGGLCHPFNPYP